MFIQSLSWKEGQAKTLKLGQTKWVLGQIRCQLRWLMGTYGKNRIKTKLEIHQKKRQKCKIRGTSRILGKFLADEFTGG